MQIHPSIHPSSRQKKAFKLCLQHLKYSQSRWTISFLQYVLGLNPRGGGGLSLTCGLKTKESHHAGGLPIICVKHHSQLPPAQRSINSNLWLNIYIHSYIYSDIATSPSPYDPTHRYFIYSFSQASLSNETSSLQTRFSPSNADARGWLGWYGIDGMFYPTSFTGAGVVLV